MMKSRLRISILALAMVGLAAPLSGCHSKAKISMEAKTPPPPPPAPPPAPEAPKPAPAIVDNRIVLPGELEFEVSSAVIKETEQSLSILKQLAQIMKDNPQVTKLRIEGHTDSSGRAKKNLKLSKDRAESVATWLAAHGVDRLRLATVGYGDTRPLADNDTAEHKQMNRRTEFHLQEVDNKPVSDEGAVAVASK